MEIAVGSTNPVKVDAVERTLESHALLEPTVTPVAVDSGVPEQPWSVAETSTGARNRARRAYEAGAFDRTDEGATEEVTVAPDYAVGLEGGVARFDGVDGLSLIMWAAVTDGDRLEVGSGPSLRLPDEVACRLENGEELGPVMDDVLDTTGIAETNGAAGVLTDGLTDRTRALGAGVACAFGPFLTAYYDD
ncbi:putative non-canonical purine NTP phosphatase [Natrialba magadii ATCC 43099]|uniref:inosine/xanthosine triphosphatase n=1 Tax=Natrialba magadii (strain ATCC 43099 / DSM 3394 / CCM 3739 / CIP 104546 / IAM 13178 / JCM 8861 / NBRC 102185 / NCIMB 2190 / MS3) TaxID=547559 RepID=D3SZU8_NATMM|nr:inosine/xanthosine triphosphatase [Natrialba magadii]ADD06358.1 putative non-canonical purine NTP phosphatase [Natrialba magadii ATCC 43099]ELY31499.1 hypothetical protein C500_06386 [Natrialba magadii ATCC 43099]